MKISSRHILKTAGTKEAKKADGLNFDHVTKTLSEGGSKQVSKEEILAAKLIESNLLISSDKIEQIRSLELVPDARKRVNDIELALIIIGAVITSSSKEEAKSAVELFDWYLQYKELSPGSFGIDNSITQDPEKIESKFKELFDKVKKVKEESDATSKQSGGKEYISNEVVYNFGDGWKVVYVPAVGEIESFPGFPETSHDRILEGNKNGLCLGASQRLYQDNGDGKIFSVRDPENNPRVTIRIFGSSLEEAKGKNNNPPDVDGAIHAKEWFESLGDLSYEDSYDFKRFPPTDVEEVISAIGSDPASPFKNGWAPHWYGKGIQVLDEDIEKKFADLDPAIIVAGFGKYPKFFEKTKPVVIHWCKKYVNESSEEAANTLFGSGYEPPTHEVYKTYRKEEFMKRAAEKLSRKDPNRYFRVGLQEYPEYKSFSDHPIRIYMRYNPSGLLHHFSEKPWAEPYINDAAEIYAKQNPFVFLSYFSEKPWAEPYVDVAARVCVERNPFGFLKDFSEKPWAKEARPELEGTSYLGIAARACAEQNPIDFLDRFSEEPWAEPYIGDATKAYAEQYPYNFLHRFSEKPWAQKERPELDGKSCVDIAAKAYAERAPTGFLIDFSKKPWAKESRPELNGTSYLGIAARACAEQDPYGFLSRFSEKTWAEPYRNDAAKACAEKNPRGFLIHFSEEPWAQKERPELDGKSCVDIAAKACAERDPHYFLRYFYEKEWAKEARLELKGKSYVDLAREALNAKNLNQTASKVNVKLLKLAGALQNLRSEGLSKEITQLKDLARNCE